MCKERTALEEIRAMDDVTITADQAAKALGVNGQSIRIQAQKDPGALGFPIIRIGGRLMIPRIPFVVFLGGMYES